MNKMAFGTTIKACFSCRLMRRFDQEVMSSATRQPGSESGDERMKETCEGMMEFIHVLVPMTGLPVAQQVTRHNQPLKQMWPGWMTH